MKIYFVRHGSTDSLEKNICQSDNEPLSQKGIEEAKQLAKRFKNIKIDLVISSPYTRAIQTAKYISKEHKTSKLFIEVLKPKEVIGKSHDDKEVKAILEKIHKMYIKDISWHYNDEENYQDLKKRATKAIIYLEKLKQENIIVVSHGNFLCFLAGLMMLNDLFSPEIFLKLKDTMRLYRTGVSIVTYDDNQWKLECWNDTSHCLE
jgi:2,3-bisphosphoglycerate-dependent phosphoglycerate mutase